MRVCLNIVLYIIPPPYTKLQSAKQNLKVPNRETNSSELFIVSINCNFMSQWCTTNNISLKLLKKIMRNLETQSCFNLLLK